MFIPIHGHIHNFNILSFPLHLGVLGSFSCQSRLPLPLQHGSQKHQGQLRRLLRVGLRGNLVQRCPENWGIKGSSWYFNFFHRAKVTQKWWRWLTFTDCGIDGKSPIRSHPNDPNASFRMAPLGCGQRMPRKRTTLGNSPRMEMALASWLYINIEWTF